MSPKPTANSRTPSRSSRRSASGELPRRTGVVSDSADWACNEKFGYKVDGEPRPTQTHAIQFHLQKVEGKWYVEGRTVAAR